MTTLKCPDCGVGIEKLVGHGSPWIYDGVLAWGCSICGIVWGRATGRRAEGVPSEAWFLQEREAMAMSITGPAEPRSEAEPKPTE